MTQYRAPVIQAASAPFDLSTFAEKAVRLLCKAVDGGARLVFFSEVSIGGYPKGASFGAAAGMGTPKDRDAYRRYFEGAVDLRESEIALIAEARRARESVEGKGRLTFAGHRPKFARQAQFSREVAIWARSVPEIGLDRRVIVASSRRWARQFGRNTLSQTL